MDLATANRKKYMRMYPVKEEEIERINIPKKSQAGMKWFENSLKKVIAVYLVMNAVILFFSSDYYMETKSGGYGNANFLKYLIMSGSDQTTINKTVDYIIEQQRTRGRPVINLETIVNETRTNYFSDNTALDIFRNSEVKYYILKEESVTVRMVENDYDASYWDSFIQIFSLVFACLVLFFSYFAGSKDSEIFLTKPFRSIFYSLNRAIRNPIDYLINPYYLKPSRNFSQPFENLEGEYALLGNFVLMYSQYLSYAIGSKQCNLVVDRLLVKSPKSLSSVVGDVYNAYIVMIQLPFSMKDVDLFDDRMVSFIAMTQEIIQRTADKFNGASSCLFDGKFVLVWRLNSDNYKSNFEVGNRNSSEAAAMCVTCVLKIIAKLGRLKSLYQIDKLLRKKNLGKSSKTVVIDEVEYETEQPENSVNCIVHCGKIYEHIIGGSLKIDVCYLGPDIAYIDRLHNMSILYDVPIMMTEPVYNFMADSIKKQCRMIDVIKLKNDDKSMSLYSLDVNYHIEDKAGSGESSDNIKFEMEKESFGEFRLFHSRIKEKILERLIKGAKNSIYFEDPDIQSLFKKKPEFKRACRKAIDFYTLGAWDMAKNELEIAMRCEPEDGACWFLLKYIEEFDYKKPEFWRGFRQVNF